MARYPDTIWLPLPESGAPDGYDKTQFIVHSTGTTASAANNASYFARTDVSVESTLIVGLTPNDPTLQVMDSTDKADANYTASRRAISVEVVGTGDMPFTQHQIDELIRLGRLAHRIDGIPLRICPTHDASGYGWHVMFGAPSPWTTVPGKVCPGSIRIRQLREVVFPAIFRTTTRPPTEDAMTPEQWNDLVGKRIDAEIRPRLESVLNAVGLLVSVAERPLQVETRLAAKLGALTEQVKVLAEAGGADVAVLEAAAERGAKAALDDLRIVTASEG